MYSEIEIAQLDGSVIQGLVKEVNGVVSQIPIDPANSDYQAYLAYLAEQETA